MREAAIDCRGFVPRSNLHKVFAEALSLPDYYGNNLDALHDCLTSLPEQTHILLHHWAAAEESLGKYAHALRRVLADSEKENPRLRITIE